MTGPAEIVPYMLYRDVATALDWLARAFAFTENMRVTTPGGGLHAEMRFRGQRIMMGQSAEGWQMGPPCDTGTATMGVFIYLDDVDAHYGHAEAAGVEIVHAPKDVDYGRTYAAKDLDGHPWFFTTPPRA